MATDPTNFRLDTEAKEKAYAIFATVGLKPAQAINLFLRQVALRGGLPFEIKVPNAETIEAITEIKKGGGKKFNNTKEFYKDLGI
jgi:DNA-damage-inducible protein J